MSPSRKSVLITGCSPGGIGNALAREFQSRGLRVFATARKRETIADLEKLGIETLALEVDQKDSVERCKEEVERLTGDDGLDYLVNNAGRNYVIPALDISFTEVQAVFDTNVFAVMRMCTTFTPLLLRARGTIVQIGSVAGIMPYVWGSIYNASKAALRSYSSTLRVELAPLGVHVITVVTGGVKSNIARVDRSLPKDSFYRPLQKEYARRQVHSQEVGMQTERYAQEVVGKVLGAKGWLWTTKSIWAGGGARRVWWASSFLPEGVWDGIFGWMFGLGRLRQMAQQKKRV